MQMTTECEIDNCHQKAVLRLKKDGSYYAVCFDCGQFLAPPDGSLSRL